VAQLLCQEAPVGQNDRVAERVRVREIDDDEGRRLLRIIRRGTGSVVTWRRAQMAAETYAKQILQSRRPAGSSPSLRSLAEAHRTAVEL
jgi:hypothetical protein